MGISFSKHKKHDNDRNFKIGATENDNESVDRYLTEKESLGKPYRKCTLGTSHQGPGAASALECQNSNRTGRKALCAGLWV